MTTPNDKERKLVGVIMYFANESKDRHDRLEMIIKAHEEERKRKDSDHAIEVSKLKERLSRLEGQHEYVREDLTGKHKLPIGGGKNETLEALKTVKDIFKTIGPWILGLLALVGTLVQFLLDKG